MNFFFQVAAFCFIFTLVFTVLKDVKNVREKRGKLLNVFIISLVFSILCDLTKWLLLMAVSFFTE